MSKEKKIFICGGCGDEYSIEDKAKKCCKKRKDNNPRVKKVIYGREQLKELTELKENFEKGW